MKFIETGLSDCWLITTEPVGDDRGYFMRTFCAREFEEAGLNPNLAQTSISYNQEKGTLRGLHFQTQPHMEDKLVRCIQGAIFDVMVDVRPGSPTFGKWYAAELSATNNHQLYAPKGFAHGFQTLTSDCIVSYHIAQFYAPESASGLRWDDPQIGVSWPLAPVNQSHNDLQLSTLATFDQSLLIPYEAERG